MPTRRRDACAPTPCSSGPLAWLRLTRRVITSLALAAGLAASPARAQQPPGPVPQPELPDTYQRSGLLNRFVPIESHLPPDPKRDQWYDTRFGDQPNHRQHPNYYTNGGLYGLPWRIRDSRSVYPYFYGSPGKDTITADSPGVRHPFWRPAAALFHPFRPVGYYYDQGSYVPVYDLDPGVPGPGPMILPFFRRITSMGG